MSSSLLDQALAQLPSDSRILDAGGWFRPEARATHVVDFMPYETRACRLQPEPAPGERFSRSTWQQVNFLDPNLRLPFADGWFAFSICSHTLEDLVEPRPLLQELQRVSRAGFIETPSRLLEQTVGVRDRITGQQGHPHHHWIVEVEGTTLRFFRKTDSLRGNPASRIPLRWYEAAAAEEDTRPFCRLLWRERLDVTFVPGAEARVRAAEFVRACGIPRREGWRDALTRAGRRLKRRLRRPPPATDWWQEMLRLSQPYTRIPLS